MACPTSSEHGTHNVAWKRCDRMRASFGQEILGRPVVDRDGSTMGLLIDVLFESSDGAILALLVEPDQDIEQSSLPWPLEEGSIRIPIADVARIGSRVHLR